LAQAGVDYLMAATIPSLEEAVGMARAMAQTRVPSIVSFVIDRQGRLLDGNSLEQAIDRIEASCSPRPSGYMINCSYPSFLHPEREDRRILDRILGYQANASSWQHHELDHCEQMQMDDVQDWGRGMLRLHREYGLQILGGCCGTGQEHLRYLVDNR
jgi:S-methylmethionine-dependent homocysteine/selenocysteine methylase